MLENEVNRIHSEMQEAMRRFGAAIGATRIHYTMGPFVKGAETAYGHWLHEYIKCWDRLEELGMQVMECPMPLVYPIIIDDDGNIYNSIRWHEHGGFEEPKGVEHRGTWGEWSGRCR
jgi:hypothetical protein